MAAPSKMFAAIIIFSFNQYTSVSYEIFIFFVRAQSYYHYIKSYRIR